MTEQFGCSESDVHSAVDTAITVLGPYQALAATKSKARTLWNTTDPAERLSASARPRWTQNGIQPPDANVVRAEFEKSLRKWQKVYSANEPFGEFIASNQLLDFLDSRLGAWNGIKRSDLVWRIDWGGKEVLKFVRQQLSVRAAGWWSIEAGKPVAWDRIGSRAKQDDHDRKIERELQRHLVKRLLQHVLSDAGSSMRAELDRLTALLSS